MTGDHAPRTTVVRGRQLTLAHRLDPAQLEAAAELLRAVIRADGHRGVGAGALEALGPDPERDSSDQGSPGQDGSRPDGPRQDRGDPDGDDRLGVLAGDLDQPGGVLDGLAFGEVQDGDRWTVELTVRPARRGQGLGGVLLDAVLAARPAGTRPQVWAYLPGPAHQKLAARHGLTPIRHLDQLRGPTAGARAPEQPGGGLGIRGFRDGDLAALVALHNRAFSYEHLDAGEVATRLARPFMGPDHLLVAVAPDGRLAGYIWMASPRPDGEGEGAGELVLLAVDPDWQGHHLGQALTAAGLALLARRGVERCMLYMDAANHPARRVYERAGFTLHHTDILYGLPDPPPGPAGDGSAGDGSA